MLTCRGAHLGGKNDFCQFQPEAARPFFRHAGANYCYFHAPNEAVLVRDAENPPFDRSYDGKYFNGKATKAQELFNQIPVATSGIPPDEAMKKFQDAVHEERAKVDQRFSRREFLKSLGKQTNLPDSSKGLLALSSPTEFQDRLAKMIESTTSRNQDYKPKRLDSSLKSYRRSNIYYRLVRPGLTDLRGIIVPDRVTIQGLTLTDVDFSESLFIHGIDFENCEFKSRARFSFSEFSDISYFSDCRFRATVDFEYCVFAEDVSFHGSRFEAEIDLSNVTGKSIFHLCCKDRSSYKEDDAITPRLMDLNISNSTFHKFLCLKNRDIKQWSISNVTFVTAPDLTRCTVPDDTSFADAAYPDASPQAATKYTVLQKLAKSVNDQQGSELFRARIFACQRANPNVPILGRVVLAMYGISTKYGTNYTRPLVILLCVTLLSGLLYLGWRSAWDTSIITHEMVTKAVRFTLRQVFKPFDALSEGRSPTQTGFFERPSILLTIVATVQSLLSLSLAGVFLHTFYRVFSRE